jgi:hypothetical protein
MPNITRLLELSWSLARAAHTPLMLTIGAVAPYLPRTTIEHHDTAIMHEIDRADAMKLVGRVALDDANAACWSGLD